MHTPCIPVSYRAIVRVLSEVSFFSLYSQFSPFIHRLYGVSRLLRIVLRLVNEHVLCGRVVKKVNLFMPFIPVVLCQSHSAHAI